MGFVASSHLLETCLQSQSYTHAPSQAGEFGSPKVSLVTVSFSGPSVMKCSPSLAVSVNMGWRTRGPAPVSWKSGEDLGLIEEIKCAVVGPNVVASLVGKQDRGLWWRRAKTDLSSSSTGLSELSLVGCHHSAGILSEWRDATCDFSQASLNTQGYSGAAASYVALSCQDMLPLPPPMGIMLALTWNSGVTGIMLLYQYCSWVVILPLQKRSCCAWASHSFGFRLLGIGVFG